MYFSVMLLVVSDGLHGRGKRIHAGHDICNRDRQSIASIHQIRIVLAEERDPHVVARCYCAAELKLNGGGSVTACDSRL